MSDCVIVITEPLFLHHSLLITHYYSSLITSNFQSVISKLDSVRQERGITCVFHIMSNVREIGAARLKLFDVLERSIHPQMSRVFFEAQTVEYKHVQVAHSIHGLRRNLA